MSLKAFMFTLNGNLNSFPKDFNQNQPEIEEEGGEEEFEVEKNSKKGWFKKLIKALSKEFEYNVFIRIGLLVYLELCILSMVNIRYYKVGNFYQILSLFTSVIFLLLTLIFLIWSMKLSCSKYEEYKKKYKIDIPEYNSFYGEYKCENIPCVLFNSYFMIRRLLFACIIVLLPTHPLIQTFCFIMI